MQDRKRNKKRNPTTGGGMPPRERLILKGAINRLSPEQGEILNMRIWKGTGIGEIANHLVMDWEEAQEIIDDALSNVEYDLIRRKLKIEDYPFLFKKLEEAA